MAAYQRIRCDMVKMGEMFRLEHMNHTFKMIAEPRIESSTKGDICILECEFNDPRRGKMSRTFKLLLPTLIQVYYNA